MKSKINKIWGVGLVLVLAVSLLLSAAPVSAGTLSWSSETIPSSTGNVVVLAADITDMAVGADGVTIWAVDDTNDKLYKSSDAGKTWSDKTSTWTADTTFTSPILIAIAPDDPDIVAIVSGTIEVSVSTNGGTSFGDLGTVQQGALGACTGINDVSVSQEDSGTNYIAVAGYEVGPVANIWYFNVGAAAPAWKETNSLAGFRDVTAEEAVAVEFSPNFASDMVMTAVTEDDAVGVYFEIFSMNQKLWNNNAGFGSGYATALVANAAITDATASISLSPDYLGSDDALRVAFVGLDLTGYDAGDGIYRLKDTSLKDLKTAVDIYSIAYDGTNVVAGQAGGGNGVYYCSDPLVSSPTVSTASSLKRPGGYSSTVTNVIVAWNGADVVAGAIGDQSAFAVSDNNGKSFNDISLIDTAMTNISDVALSADGEALYLAVDDAQDFSLFRMKDGDWQRVLGVDAIADCIVRIAPEDSDVVYVADQLTKVMYYSSSGGDEKWFSRACKYDIQDMAVESAGVIYVAVKDEKTVSKSTNSGFTWKTAKSTSLAGTLAIAMIRSLDEDELMVGSKDGYISYSSDGNDSWTKISKVIETGGLLVQADASGLDDGDFIYAASSLADTKVLSWEIGESSSWTDLSAPTASGYMAYGIEYVDGMLYVLTSDGTDSASMRTLGPTASTVTWCSMATTDGDNVSVETQPQSLKVTSGSTKLWTSAKYDTGVTDVEKLYSYEDTMATEGPDLSGPGDGAAIEVNRVSGAAFDISFSWERPSKAIKYELQVAVDDGFSEKVLTQVVPSTTTTTSGTIAQIVGPGAASPYTLSFMPGTTYYWHVRAYPDGAKPYSPWSATRSFTVAELPEAAAPVIIEQPPAPVIAVPPTPEIIIQSPDIIIPTPEIILPAPEVNLPPAPAQVEAIPGWALYVIIIIGAVLMVALIVLILRTRRPV